MEKALSKTPDTLQNRWQNPDWYYAMTLTERIASQRINDTPSSASHGTQSTKWAEQRLQSWKAQKPFDHGTFFADRLAIDAITEDDLLSLLAEPIEAVQARLTALPDWLEALVKAFEHPFNSDRVMPLPQVSETNHSLAALLNAIKPLINRGLDRLFIGIQELSQRYDFLPFDQDSIIHSLLVNLSKQLLPRLSKTFVLEMHVARIQDRLSGTTPEERYKDFVRQLCQPDGILPILEEYPVLARQLVITIDHWTDYALEFLDHLCADWSNISATFTSGNDPGLLVEIRGGAGDLHRRGRSVLVLKFSSGFQLLYKPKSLAIDVHFQELLIWLNERGANPAFKTVKIIDRGSYGWSEFVQAQACTSNEEVARFYERQGSYLALLYALDATDFHAENLIAAGEHPVLIDLEALFHPRIAGYDLTQPNQIAFKTMGQSVLRVGLLPHRMWSNEEVIGIDRSGLGGQEGQLSPRPLPKWQSAGTDEMWLVRARIEIPASQNRPKLGSHDVDVLDYSENIITGFTSMYQLLMEHGNDLLARPLLRFAHDEIRLIVRHTRTYSILLTESFHPDLLREALDRDRFFDNLWIGVEQRPTLARVIPAERRDLLRGDIPMFTTHPDSRTIFTDEGEEIPDFLEDSSLHLVQKRIQQLDTHDLDRQTWLIQASLATILMGTDQATRREFRLKPSRTPVSRERLMASAYAIGERLCDLALRSDYGASWVGVALVKEHVWDLLPADLGLYSGTTGILLFLSYLGALTGKAEYASLAELALASVRARIEQQKKYLAGSAIGAFDGLGAPIYLFSHLGVLWNDPALLREAEELVEQLPPLIETDGRLDIIGGSAGCLLSLLSLYHARPSLRTLAVALQCGNHLVSIARPMKEGMSWTTLRQEIPLAGFSHGAAGIASSLLRLADISGERHFRETAMAALAYERSLFSTEKQNWADLRTPPPSDTTGRRQSASEENQRFMTAWCHGAPGIGLSRLDALKYIDDETIREEIDIAVRTTISAGFGRNHSLCHGDLGNLDLLVTATQILDDPQHREHLERLTAMILESIDAYGWVTGVPLGVETPGLMTGLAGIGYELLRLAEPEKVPSVLLLAPPLGIHHNR